MRVITCIVLLLLPICRSYSQVKIKHNVSRGNPVGTKYSADQTFMVIAEKKSLNLYAAGVNFISCIGLVFNPF